MIAFEFRDVSIAVWSESAISRIYETLISNL